MHGALHFSEQREAPKRLRLLSGIDVRAASFVRLASGRISAMDTAASIEAALKEVPNGHTRATGEVVRDSEALGAQGRMIRKKLAAFGVARIA